MMVKGGPCSNVVTWNPADKDTHVSLSNGNLTAVNDTPNVWSSGRATHAKSAGKWYWEVKCELTNANMTFVGVGNSSFQLNAVYVGFDLNGWGFQDGAKYHSTSAAYGSTVAQNDIISVLLDMDAGTITLWKNGTTMGQMYSGLTGSLYPALSTYVTTGQLTANFGATAFVYTIPSGYSAFCG